jgi:hypothetical protein
VLINVSNFSFIILGLNLFNNLKIIKIGSVLLAEKSDFQTNFLNYLEIKLIENKNL